jgi:hypothetical protein
LKYIVLLCIRLKEDLSKILPNYSRRARLYEEATHNAIVDMSIGLRGSGLPSLVLENIANQSYNPAGMDVYQLVKNITQMIHYFLFL